ncbi:S1C family serine protease [Marinicella rhabdoformis]|uniref:S1C family serine protease n=1 Tax=Marinicella rhabdoformis TaxID=2580566 RepID=UPI0012AED86D|nr:trypsin-like peptidase domain-containing protein [Marinicella rhabdoformis]
MKKHLIFVGQSVVIGLAVAFTYLWSTGRITSHTENSVNTPATGQSYAKAVQTIAPAVVGIYVQSHTQIPNSNPGISPAAPYVTRNFVGSGVIVSPDGHIVTNHHVTAGASKIYVTLWNNELFEAQMVGSDKETDLAVIKIDANNLTPAHFADSEYSNTGDVVLAIGNPYGLNQSVSLGIISATGRKGLNISSYENFIQTDAAINEGNSGGALVNSLGEVVGISTASYIQHGAEGINFAIPSNTTKQIVDSIITYGEVRRGWFGIYFYKPEIYFIYGLKRPEKGVQVARVYPNSIALSAGIKKNDVITHVDGEAVNSFLAYDKKLNSLTVDDKVIINVIRDDKPFEVELTVQPRPET